jgi:hypothetical protein
LLLINSHRGLRIAGQLEAGFYNMPALKILELSFHIGCTSGIPAWNVLAKLPKFPNLEELILDGCNMNVRDMTKFVLKQTDTLKVLDLSTLRLHKGTLDDMSLFYKQLSMASKLEDYRQSGLALVTVVGNRGWVRTIGLPRHLCLPYIDEDENEDGYIEVGLLTTTISWKGNPEVKDMLLDLSVCLF